jgi:hypothetical protein
MPPRLLIRLPLPQGQSSVVEPLRSCIIRSYFPSSSLVGRPKRIPAAFTTSSFHSLDRRLFATSLSSSSHSFSSLSASSGFHSSGSPPFRTAEQPFVQPISPLHQSSRRSCSSRRMCHWRHADAGSASTGITASREVLPTNVKPLHYDLTLEPDFEKFSFEGTVIIEYVITFPLNHPSSLSPTTAKSACLPLYSILIFDPLCQMLV